MKDYQICFSIAFTVMIVISVISGVLWAIFYKSPEKDVHIKLPKLEDGDCSIEFALEALSENDGWENEEIAVYYMVKQHS